MNKLQISPKFKDLIPPLTQLEYEGLEELIVKEGIRDALITWKGVIVDGHNRFEIAEKHGITGYAHRDKEFKDEAEVMMWIIDNQLGRRNLTSIARIELAKKKAPLIKAKAKERQAEYHGNQYDSGLPQKSAEVQTRKRNPENETREQLAKLAGVSHDTLKKGMEILETAPPELINEVRDGKKAINKAYREMQTGTVICKVCGEEKPASESSIDIKSLCLNCRSAQKRESKRVRKEALQEKTELTATQKGSAENEEIATAFKTIAEVESQSQKEPPINGDIQPIEANETEVVEDEEDYEDAGIAEATAEEIEIEITEPPEKETVQTHEEEIPINPNYTIEAFKLEFRENARSYTEVAKKFVTGHYSPLWKKPEYKTIALAALDEVIAAISNLKGLV